MRQLSVIVILTVSINALAQVRLNEIPEIIDEFVYQHPSEKVYLHLDKPHYFPNDTIWFKAYAVPARYYTGGALSLPLYVELINLDNGDLIERKIFRLQNGLANGEFALPDSIQCGNVNIRAYTQWMRNYGEQSFYTKDLMVCERGYFPERSAKDSLSFDIQFFPEGGHLIAGIENRVAFKAIGSDGKGIRVEGFIRASKENQKINFETEYLGMGIFTIKPQLDIRYEVYVKRPEDHNYLPFEFPNVKAYGYQMRIENNIKNNMLYVLIQQNIPTESLPEKMLLLATDDGLVTIKSIFEPLPHGKQMAIPKDKLAPGILVFSLMNEAGIILCERLVYNHPFKQAAIDIKSDQITYKKRDSVQLEIAVLNERLENIPGQLSIAVTDAGQVQHVADAANIVSYLQLLSQIKGPVEKPGYYFNPENPHAEQHLDLLLLTQGWRKYKWHDAITENEPEFEHLMELGLTVAGQIRKPNGNTVEERHLITMIINQMNQMPDFYEGESDRNGFFAFGEMYFEQYVEIFIQAYTKKEKKRKGADKIVKNNVVEPTPQNFPEIVARYPLLDYSPGSQILENDEYIIEVDKAIDFKEQYLYNYEIMLDEISITARKQDVVLDTRALQYGGNPTYRFEVTPQFYSYQNVFHLLRGRYAGVTVVGDVFGGINTPSVFMRGMNSSLTIGGGAQFLIDGQPAMPQSVMTMPIAEIEKIDILRGLARNAVFGAEGSGGTINILTKQGNPNFKHSHDPRLNRGNASFVAQGYSMPKAFYVPKFNADLPEVLQTDYRSTIYWNPFVQTDLTGKASVTFPLTDGKTDVKVIIEGLGENNEPLYGEVLLKVR